MITKIIDPPYVMAAFTYIRAVVEEENDKMNKLTSLKLKKLMVIWGMKHFGMKMVLA